MPQGSLKKVLEHKYVPTTEFYSMVIDSLQDYSILTVDNDLLINSWSAGAETIFQYKPEEILGQHFEIIFTDEDKKTGTPANEIAIADKEGRATDNRYHICKDKSTFFAYGLVFPLLGPEGEKLGYVKILRDITAAKDSEESIQKYVKELEDLNTHKESVLAILSHDLRSPLAGIIGASAYLKSNFEKMKPDTVREMLELLHKSSQEELNMLDYLLEWARIKYASESFSPTKLELELYVKKVFATLKETAALNAINLHHEIEENTIVFADSKMLLSILQNIVANAIKHCSKNGKITITAKKDIEKIIVEVKDTGCGMSEEIRDKLFKPQIDSLSHEREGGKGAGIGLLLVKGFLEKSGGEIWVESIEGEGSSFFFTLPTKQSPLI
jgi:PAS domain S-box-containing protein